MKPKNKPNATWALAAMAVAASLSWTTTASASTPVTVLNPGFEDPAIPADGTLGPLPTGWNALNGSGASIVGLNPSSSIDLTAEAPEGSNVGLVSSTTGDGGFAQVLTSRLQASATYSLSVKVANTKFTAGFPGYRIQLLAGGTVLAEDDNSLAPGEDVVVTSTVPYIYNVADAALVGQALEVRLLSKGGTNEVAFDDVKLTVTLINPVADPGGPYLVAIPNGSLSLNGSASLPSDGRTIISYEWDLNNDGIYGDVTGVTPPSITRTDLQTTYGMVIGANTIKLRVTDNSSPTPKISIATGTVNLAPPLAGQLGILDLTANGGINPNTGVAWALGDKYRLAFYTAGTSNASSTDPAFYNAFVSDQAKLNTPLAGAYWRAMISTASVNAKVNTGTTDLTGGAAVGGAGVPVYVMNGKTCIARNNADIWDTWSNPFQAVNPTVRTGTVYYSPYLNQYGAGDSGANHGLNVWTGSNSNGTPLAGQEVGHVPNTNWGSSNANNSTRVWNRGNSTNTTTSLSFYAISVPLSIVDLSETVAPNLISFVDNRGGADAILGVNSVIYTVTFSEAINAATLTVDDFENAGTATVTIDSIRGTQSASAFEVVVTPTSSGTLKLQAKAGAVIKDPVGNAVNTTSAIADDTTITVVGDVTAPTLVSIVDNVSGGPIVAFTGLVYTVTFDEGINASSIDIADFGNSGTAPITITSVSPTGNPAVYTVAVTTAGPGSLTLNIVAGATITDLIGNPLVTTAALPDDTTITVTPDPLPTLVSITDNQGGGPIFAGESFAYSVAFDQVINPATLDAADFGNGGNPVITVNAVVATSDPKVFTVHVTPGGAGTITLQIKAGAVITNVNGTALDATTALADDNTITVNAGSGPARGIITVNGTTFWSASSATLSGTLNASGSDKLVVIVTGENANPGDLSGNSSSVTYDGVPLTKVVDRNPIGGTPVDQTFNDIWYLDNPATSTGAIVASVNSRGSVTAFALSGTAPGVGQTAISPQASRSVVLSTSFANSIVIASHGMGGDGNTANVTVVDAVLPLIETSATAQASGAPSPWDGHVTAYALIPSAGTASYSFTGGNLVGSHTIAAEFIAAVSSGGSPYNSWTAGPFAGTLSNTAANTDFDNGGLATGVEWVVGGDPTNGGDDASVAPTLDNTTDPDFLIFTYRRSDAANTDANTAIKVEYGTNLSNWTTAVAGPDIVITQTDNFYGASPGIDRVQVKIRRTLAVGGKLFARMKVAVTMP